MQVCPALELGSKAAKQRRESLEPFSCELSCLLSSTNRAPDPFSPVTHPIGTATADDQQVVDRQTEVSSQLA